MKKLYHATIHAKLEKILEKGAIMPGKETEPIKRADPDFEDEAAAWGFYDNFSFEHVYAWNNKDSAIANALNLSRTAHTEIYSDEDRIPVLIPFSIDEKLVKKDLDSGEYGFMVKGPIKKFDEPILLELQKPIYKVEKLEQDGKVFWWVSYNN